VDKAGRTTTALVTVLVILTGGADAFARGRGGRGTVRYSGRATSSTSRHAPKQRTATQAKARRPSRYGSVRHSTASKDWSDIPGRLMQAPIVPEGTDALGSDTGVAAVVRVSGEAGAGTTGQPAAVSDGATPAIGSTGPRPVAGRGPRNRGALADVPDGSLRVRVGDQWHYRHGYRWYRPYWHGDDVYYQWIYPPVGYYYPELPASREKVDAFKRTFYYVDGVYYEQGTRNGQAGYLVSEPPGEAETKAEAIDPREILRRMSDFLADQKQFRVESEHHYDEVLSTGQKVRLSSRRAVSIRRPDAVAAEVIGDGHDKRFTYDGRTLTVFDRDRNMYASAPMPDTIDGMLDTMAERYGAVIPAADLLYSDPYKAIGANVKGGRYIGLHEVGGYPCHHLAFTGDVVDWQIWIQDGARPLPRLVLLTYKTLTGQPRYAMAVSEWVLDTPLPESLFRTTPPSGAERIEMVPTRPGAAPDQADGELTVK